MTFLPGAERCSSVSHVTHGCDLCKVEALETLIVPDALLKLFSTNDPPNSQILPSLLASLDTVRSLSADVDECIASMESILSRIRRAKETCTLSIAQHEAVFHPIHSIPDDILLEIFEWYTWSQTTRKGRAPWTLSHISRRWRALTLSSGSLWSTIIIPWREMRSDGSIQSLLEEWSVVIPRSMNCDLFIHLVSAGYNMDSRVDEIHHLLLPPTTRRWKILELPARPGFLVPVSLCSFDRLTTLVLFGDPLNTETISMFTRAPNLSCLKLGGVAEINIDVQWERITTYSCTLPGLRYLHKLTALEHLTLDLELTPQNASPTSIFPVDVPVPLSLSTLRSVSIAYSSFGFRSTCILDILDLLYLPSLTRTVTALSVSAGVDLELFGPLPHLREFCVDCAYSPDKCVAFLTTYASITSLHVRSIIVLHTLLVVADKPVLLPHLTILGVDRRVLVVSPEDVLEILESRCRHEGGRVEQLSEVRFSGSRSLLLPAKAIYEGENWKNVCGKVKVIEAPCSLCSRFHI